MEFGLTIFGRRFEIRVKALPANLRPLSPLSGTGGWWPVIREPYTGAWQKNDETRADTVLAYSAVFACVTLIAADVAKLCLRLVEQDEDGIWTETENPAYSPVLRKPNRYQTITKLVEVWIVSKLCQGNTYVLKQRDQRGVVIALYVLDPSRVTPLVAPDGAVWYQLRRDDLSGIPEAAPAVPASEIIHDTMVPLFHPLLGVTPIYACGLAAVQGLSIQVNSNAFFANGSKPGGILTAPGEITDEQGARFREAWEKQVSGDNIGRLVILGGGLKYESVAITATDAQLIEQLKWTAENVCSCFHVPPYMIGVGPPPPYANIEPLLQQYYSQCIQSLLTNFEKCLDEGLGIDQKVNGTQYGTEFDIDDLIWMDTATRTKAASESISGGSLSPNEARKKYQGVGPVAGGDAIYLQQQYYSLEALAERDANEPFAKPAPAPPPGPPPDPEVAQDDVETKAADALRVYLRAA